MILKIQTTEMECSQTHAHAHTLKFKGLCVTYGGNIPNVIEYSNNIETEQTRMQQTIKQDTHNICITECKKALDF